MINGINIVMIVYEENELLQSLERRIIFQKEKCVFRNEVVLGTVEWTRFARTSS